MKFISFIRKINPRIIFLIILVSVLVTRFGIKMLNDYQAWDYFHHYFAAQNIFTNNNIYADSYMGARYTRSPFFAIMIYPLGLLPRNISSFVWCLSIIVSLAGIYLICEKLFISDKSKRNFLWMCAAPLTLIFLQRLLISEFLMGQANIIMLFLVMLALLFKEKNRPVLAALFLVLAINIKLTPILFLPYFLFKKEIKLVTLTGLFLITSLLLPAIFVSWNRNLELLNNWHNTLKYYNSLYNSPIFESAFGTQSLFIFFKRFLFGDNYKISLFHIRPIFAKYLSYFVFLAIYSSMLFFKSRNVSRDKKILSYIDYNILIICMALFSPLAGDHTYMNMIVPIIFLLYLFKEYKLYKKLIFFWPAILFSIASLFTGTKLFKRIGIYDIQGETYVYFVLMTAVWQALMLLFMLFLLKFRFLPQEH